MIYLINQLFLYLQTFSALTLIPVEEDGSIPAGAIRGMTHSRGTTFDNFDSPSEHWPVSMATFLTESPIEGKYILVQQMVFVWRMLTHFCCIICL